MWLWDLLKEIAQFPVQRQLLQLEIKQRETAERLAAELLAENAALKVAIADLQSQLDKAVKRQAFVESDGLLWRRNGAGEFEDTPYCPKCQTKMYLGLPAPYGNWHCDACTVRAPNVRPPRSGPAGS